MAPPSRSTTSTLSARVLLRAIDYVASLGHTPESLCQAMGLSLQALRAPDARVPATVVEALAAHAARITGDANFGLHLGLSVSGALEDDPGVLLLMACANARDALHLLVRVQRHWSDVDRASIVPDVGGLRLRYAFPCLGAAAQRHTDECAFAELVVSLRAFTATSLAPREVTFRHARPADTREHEALFRAPLRFEAEHSEIALSDASLDLPFTRASPTWKAVFERQVLRSIERTRAGETFVAQTRAAVEAALLGGDVSLGFVARLAGLSARTLQRRLRDEGTTFAAVVDAVRHAQAVELLAQGLPMRDLAERLGYADPGAFHHAFKRWTGTTPARHRSASAG